MQLRIEINQKMQLVKYDEWEKIVPYLDYWHWMIDNQFYELHNGSEQYWDIKGILEGESTPDWVREITQLVFDEFKEQLDENGGMEVYISW